MNSITAIALTIGIASQSPSLDCLMDELDRSNNIMFHQTKDLFEKDDGFFLFKKGPLNWRFASKYCPGESIPFQLIFPAKCIHTMERFAINNEISASELLVKNSMPDSKDNFCD